MAGFTVNGVGTVPVFGQKEDGALPLRRRLFDADEGGLNGGFFIRILKVLLGRSNTESGERVSATCIPCSKHEKRGGKTCFRAKAAWTG